MYELSLAVKPRSEGERIGGSSICLQRLTIAFIGAKEVDEDATAPSSATASSAGKVSVLGKSGSVALPPGENWGELDFPSNYAFCEPDSDVTIH